MFWRSLIHVLGIDNVAGYWYGWWSGSGSVILPPLITLGGLGLMWWWHHQCHVSGCYWPSRRLTAANERACWKHHPAPKRSAEDIHKAHHAALKG